MGGSWNEFVSWVMDFENDFGNILNFEVREGLFVFFILYVKF